MQLCRIVLLTPLKVMPLWQSRGFVSLDLDYRANPRCKEDFISSWRILAKLPPPDTWLGPWGCSQHQVARTADHLVGGRVGCVTVACSDLSITNHWGCLSKGGFAYSHHHATSPQAQLNHNKGRFESQVITQQCTPSGARGSREEGQVSSSQAC